MQFGVVLADPPWDYADRSPHSDTKFGGGVHGNYGTHSLETMMGWREQFLATRPERQGVLLMWVTGPHYEDAPALARAWGYTPIKPIWYWIKTCKDDNSKPKPGPGNYSASNVEYILLCQANMRHKLLPHRKLSSCDAVLAPHPRTPDGRKIIHSKKPEIFHELAVRCFGPHQQYLEVFARERTPGWWAIGNELHPSHQIRPGHIVMPMPPPPPNGP